MIRSKLQARSMRVLAATALLALAGGLAQTVSAAPFGGPGEGWSGGGYGPGMGMHGAGYGMGMHGAGYGAGPRMMHGGPMMGGRWLDGVNATAEQKAQIQAIWQAARTDLRASRESGRALHDQMRNLLAQPSIDTAAVEALRQQMLALHDQASKRMSQAMIDASKVLSAEQRKQLADLAVQRRALMERHRAERESLGAGPGPRRP
jgi:Spy/CpxP family protein refolding chaperone